MVAETLVQLLRGCIDQRARPTPLRLEYGSGLAPQRLQPGVVDVGAHDGHSFDIAAEAADDVHLAHRPGGTDDQDSFARAQLARIGDDGVGVGG